MVKIVINDQIIETERYVEEGPVTPMLREICEHKNLSHMNSHFCIDCKKWIWLVRNYE